MVEYREIPGYPGYHAGDDGTVWSQWKRESPRGIHGGSVRVLSRDEWRPLRISPNGHGYRIVSLKGHPHTVGRMILLAFVGPAPSGYEVLHGPGGKLDDSLPNLKWGTRQENAADRLRDGTAPIGERNPAAKLTVSEVAEIRAIGRSLRQRVIAEKYGITQTQVSKILLRKIWAY